MATTLQFRRGDTATANGIVGNEGELFVDTQADTVIVLDGVNAGGSRLATEDFVLGITGGPNVDADTLDGEDGTYYLDYNNFTNTPTLYTSSDFDTDFAANTTDDLTEGATNLYYADSLVDTHLTGSTGVTYSAGSISIGQAVDTTDDVTFNTVSLSAEPTQSSHATTKQYVDEIAQGLSTLPSAEYATTGNLGGTYSSGTLTASSNGELQVDGVTVSVDDNILVKDQNNANENGSYNVVQVGDASNPWILQRSVFADESEEIPGSFEFVTGGNTNANTGWVFTVSDPATFGLGVDPITVTQFSGAGTFLAGSGLDLNGNTFSHSDTSSQSSVSNTGSTVIQSVDVDTFGHITDLVSTTIAEPNNATITISAGDGMTGGGNFSTDQSSAETITISHANTSSQGSVNNSGNTFIQDITLDGYGHITGLGTATVNIPATANDATITIFAGNGLTGGGNFTTDQDSNESISLDIATDAISADELNVSGNGNSNQYLRSDGDGSFTWDTPTDTQPNNASINISAGNALTGGGSFTVDQSFNETITLDVGSNSIGTDELNVSGFGSNGQVLKSDGDGSMSWDDAVSINNNTSTNASFYVTLADSTSGSFDTATVSSTKLYFNPSSGTLNATDFNSLSDASLKENVETLENGLDVINQIRPVSFDWKDSGERSFGVIAQEIEEVLPQIVATNDEGVKSVAYDKIIAFLIDAVKTLDERTR